MSILAVNLKHLYQRPGLWLTYIFFGLLVFGSLGILFDSPSAGKGEFVLPVMLGPLIGLFTASLPVEILSKPFSYCLPGHRAVPRKFVFWVGALTSLAGSLMFLAYPSLHWWGRAPAVCSAFCAGLILYWIGVGLTFGIRNSGRLTGWAFLPIFGVFLFDVHILVERAIINHPIAIIFVGLSSSAVAWSWLGNPNWARRFCATYRIFFFDVWNREKMLELKQKRAAVNSNKSGYNLHPWVERFFLDRMNECNHLGSGRYVWGGLYTTYSLAVSRWKGILSGAILVLVMALYLSYSPPGGADVLFVMGGVIVMHMRLPVYSNMMVPGGRSERLLTALILAGSVTLLITAVLALVAAVSVALAPIMPDFAFRGADLTFHATSLRLLFVPSMMIPIVLALRLIIFEKPFSTMAAIVVSFTFAFIFLGVDTSDRMYTLFHPIPLAIMLIMSWLALVIVLRHVCLKRSLVGQSKTY